MASSLNAVGGVWSSSPGSLKEGHSNMCSELVLFAMAEVATGGCDTLTVSHELAVSSACRVASFDIHGTRTKGPQNSPRLERPVRR